jgi:hypothetical protein
LVVGESARLSKKKVRWDGCDGASRDAPLTELIRQRVGLQIRGENVKVKNGRSGELKFLANEKLSRRVERCQTTMEYREFA